MVWMSTNASFWAMTMLRSTTGMLAAKPTPCCSRRSFTASMMGPSCTDTVPSPPIASAAFGISLHRGHEGLVAPGERRAPDVGEGRRLDEPVDDARDERLEPLGRGRLEQPERLLGARRQVELLDAVEEVGGQRRDVDLLLDRRGDLVADVRLHRRLLGERRERRDELVGVDELDARPRRDHGDGCEQQRDDHEHDGRHGAPAAAAFARRRARGIRALDASR